MLMPILSIRQPWAALIILGIKDVENRSWPCKHRGPLVIHASQAVDDEAFEWLDDDDMLTPELQTVSDVRGAALGIANMTSCERWAAEYSFHDYRPSVRETRQMKIESSCLSPVFSDWHMPDQYGFYLTDPRTFENPHFMRGQLGIFYDEIPDHLLKATT